MNVNRPAMSVRCSIAIAMVLAGSSVVAASAAQAAQGAQCARPCGAALVVPGAARVPFGPGESARYDVDVGIAGGGKGSMSVEGIEQIHGFPTYHLRMEIEGRAFLLFHLEDVYHSWMDVESLYSRRFEQDQDETGFDRHRVLDFFPEEMLWRKLVPTDLTSVVDTGELASPLPLDDLSFVYFARTLPLEVGTRYSFSRYWRDTGNPVVLNVIRKDTVTVPAGTFPTIVVQPIIKTSGLFGEGGKAEIHFSDDEYRRVVYLKADIPLLSALTMKLRSFTPGTPVQSEAPGVPARESGLRSPLP
jgi:hypothetical protein